MNEAQQAQRWSWRGSGASVKGVYLACILANCTALAASAYLRKNVMSIANPRHTRCKDNFPNLHVDLRTLGLPRYPTSSVVIRERRTHTHTHTRRLITVTSLHVIPITLHGSSICLICIYLHKERERERFEWEWGISICQPLLGFVLRLFSRKGESALDRGQGDILGVCRVSIQRTRKPFLPDISDCGAGGSPPRHLRVSHSL